jgi:Domain of unknown function (DUF4190)
MASSQWDEGDDAQQALRAIVSNPVYGVPALSSAPIMANLLKDLLPDAPREVSILVAAAEAGVAGSLQDRVSQGMDVSTASAVVAGSFAASTPFRPDACTWAVTEIARALGLSSPAPSPPSGLSTVPGSSAWSAQPTISAPLRAGPGGYGPGAPAPAAYPPAAYPPGAYPPGAYPPGAYPPGAYPPGGFPSAGQAPPPSPYPSAPASYPSAPAPAPPGSAPSGYPAVGGYPPPPVPGYWPQPPGPGFVSATRTNGLAIASLVLGILWLFWLGSLVGLILGLVALKQIKSRNQRGRGIAIAGVVLGVLGLLILVIAIIAAASKGSSVS